LRVHGYSAKMDFSASDAASVKAKFTGPQLGGSLSGGLTASWNASGSLTLSSSGDFYIAGQLVKYSGTGFSSSGPAISREFLPISKEAKALLDAR
jgi:hypothetical protein